MSEMHGVQQPTPDDTKSIDRRDALRKLVRATAYTLPIATLLLSGAKDANAAVCPKPSGQLCTPA